MSVARSAWQELSWRRVALVQFLALLAVLMESFEGGLFGTFMGHPSMNYVAMSLGALVLLPVMLYADEIVNRGTPARRVYPLAIVAAFPLVLATTAGTQAVYYRLFRVTPAAAASHRLNFLTTTIDVAVVCSFGMIIYMNGRTAERVLVGVQSAELKRVQLERQLIESRLATAEARVDPQMLFGALEEIRDGFSRADPDGDAKLDRLVQRLRTALARTAAVGDTDLGRT